MLSINNDNMVKDSEISSKVLIALRRIMRAVDLYSKNLEKNYGLTSPQLIVLREINGSNGAPIGALAKMANLSNATLTGIVDRLEKRNLVERTRSLNDRRQVFVKVTSSGKDILKNAPPLLQDRFIKEFRNLNHGEQQLILKSLEKVASMMDAEQIDVAPMLSGQSLTEESENKSGSK